MTHESKPKTIVVVAHAWYDDLFGGAFRVATELAAALAASGWHVTYLCCKVGDVPVRESIRGVDVRRYSITPRRLPVPRFWQHVQGAQQLARQVASECDIVAVSGHSPLQYLGVLRELKSAPSVKCTYVVHSPFADEVLAAARARRQSLLVRARAAVASIIDRLCLQRSDVVQCLSSFTARSLVRRYGSWLNARLVECPGWVDGARFQPAMDRQSIRSRLPGAWQTEEPILLTVRRLETRMGLDTLVAAAAKIADQCRFRLLIGGTGPQEGPLKEWVHSHGLEDRIVLLGRIPEEQLAECYAAADAFVLPTRSLECFGLIVLEALASATPVIGSRVGAIPELLEQVGPEWMFDPGSVSDLAGSLENFLTGKLAAKVDLRSVAMRYDAARVLPRWIDLCTASHPCAGSSPLHLESVG